MDGFLSLIFIHNVFLLFSWSPKHGVVDCLLLFCLWVVSSCVFICLVLLMDGSHPWFWFTRFFFFFSWSPKHWSMHIWVVVSRFCKRHNFMSHVWLTSCSIMWIQRVLTGRVLLKPIVEDSKVFSFVFESTSPHWRCCCWFKDLPPFTCTPLANQIKNLLNFMLRPS